MIVPRLRSEARGGSSSGSSNRYSNSGVYGGKVHHGHHANDPDLKRALQYSYTSQTVRKWEKRWVVIHETSMKVHKWMPAPVTIPNPATQTVNEKANGNPPSSNSTVDPSTNENTNDTPAKMDTNDAEISQDTQEKEENQHLNHKETEEKLDENQEEQQQPEIETEAENNQQQVQTSNDQDKQAEVQSEHLTEDSSVISTQDTQMLVDEESTSQSSQP